MPRFNIRPFLLRRLSSKTSKADSETTTTTSSTAASSPSLPDPPALRKSSSRGRLRDKLRLHKGIPELPCAPPPPLPEDCKPRRAATSPVGQQSWKTQTPTRSSTDLHRPASPASRDAPTATPPPPPPSDHFDLDNLPAKPRLILEQPTPESVGGHSRARLSLDSPTHRPASGEVTLVSSTDNLADTTTAQDRHAPQPGIALAAPPSPPAPASRLPDDDETLHSHQSIISGANAETLRRLIDDVPARTEYSATDIPVDTPRDSFPTNLPITIARMNRKIWVKRPNASATLVQIKEEDLVDDVRDMILRKYANSLGKTFDAPDMTLRIVTRPDHAGQRVERVLGPEEEMCQTIDTHYPGGQNVDDALIIDVPYKRTPRPSPRPYNSYHPMEDLRPQETGTDYFPPMPAVIPTLPHSAVPPTGRDHHLVAAEHPRSISVLNTGQVPPLPSPGGSRRHRSEREHRPKFGRQHTSSPTIIAHPSAQAPANAVANLPAHLPHRASNRPRVDSSASEAHHANGIPPAPPLPTPPAPEVPLTGRPTSNPATPNAIGGPTSGHRIVRPRKGRKSTPDRLDSRSRNPAPGVDQYGASSNLPSVSSMLDDSVPPINVLIVEDNSINLRILESLMKRLKVRWQTAMNGQIAVDKWKGGGFHLVLMDIQMPIMNGLQATKEIRRLERVNGIGVFSSSAPGSPNENGGDGEANGAKALNPEDEKLPQADGLFKSPVIIVALTASSLQSDRHEALAAGCNDFLTKPVSFVWLERKVKEWGCMQALIDFDGWRRWKEYAAKEDQGKSDEQKQKEREQEEKQKIKMEKMAKLQEKQRQRKEEEERKKRESIEVSKTAVISEVVAEKAVAM